MNIPELQYRNYAATVRRKLITPKTTKTDFIAKLLEEVFELQAATAPDHEAEELADVMLVCLAMAKHFDIDIMAAMTSKVLKNELR